MSEPTDKNKDPEPDEKVSRPTAETMTKTLRESDHSATSPKEQK